jgi:penicillin-binding protein 2
MNKNQPLLIVIAGCLGLLLLRLVQLQIAEHRLHQSLALDNAAKMVVEPAPRGVIYDRNGKALVENRPVYSIRVLPYILFQKTPTEREQIINLLNSLLGEKLEIKISATEPILVKDNVDWQTAIKVEERKNELAGVVVGTHPVRLLTYGAKAAHVIGYVGEIESAELARLKSEGYKLGDVIGKDGVEKYYDWAIRGIDGGKRVEVDVHGMPLRVIESLEPLPGPDLKLTIDLNLQQVAEKALGQQEGAVVVLDPNNGQILAMASYPGYDPNTFTDPQKRRGLNALKYLKHPFMNRALAVNPPGSIFKVVTLTAALEEGKVTTTEAFYCPGYYKINQRYAKCWLESGHGSITAPEGLVWSCDIVFYELGRRLGPDLLSRYAQKYGLGQKSGIDLPQEKRGNVPDAAWKEVQLHEKWYEGDSINYGIGQGFVLVSPLQMATLYGEIATGKRYKPYIVAEIKNRDGEVIYQAKPTVTDKLKLKPENLKIIQAALFNVVDRATGLAVRYAEVPAAGKTGTAQNRGLPHAWFICYAPYSTPEVVVAAFVAHGQHGDKASAYIARDILKWYKDNRLKTPVSVTKAPGQYILRPNGRHSPYGRPKPKPVAETPVIEEEPLLPSE